MLMETARGASAFARAGMCVMEGEGHAVPRGRDRRDYTLRQLPATQAGPILRRYLRIAPATRPYFQASKDSPVADFVAEADRHPVFALTPISEGRC